MAIELTTLLLINKCLCLHKVREELCRKSIMDELQGSTHIGEQEIYVDFRQQSKIPTKERLDMMRNIQT